MSNVRKMKSFHWEHKTFYCYVISLFFCGHLKVFMFPCLFLFSVSVALVQLVSAVFESWYKRKCHFRTFPQKLYELHRNICFGAHTLRVYINFTSAVTLFSTFFAWKLSTVCCTSVNKQNANTFFGVIAPAMNPRQVAQFEVIVD